MSKTITVQETCMRETEIEVSEELYGALKGDDRGARDKAEEEVCKLYDATEDKGEFNEWVETVFIDEDGETELFNVN